MNEEFGLCWEVEIDDVVQEGDVDAPSGQICHQEASHPAFAEILNGHATGHGIQSRVNHGAVDLEFIQKLHGEMKRSTYKKQDRLKQRYKYTSTWRFQSCGVMIFW